MQVRALAGGSDQDKIFRLGAIALAAGVSMVWGGEANATLITEDYTIVLSSGPSTLIIGDGSPSGQPQFGPGTNGIGGEVASPGSMVVGVDDKVSDLSPGDTVGPSSPTLTGGFYSDPLKAQITANNGTSYLGLVFEIDGGTTLYGYATVDGDTLASVTYDDGGSAVTISGVPEPASLSFLALGAVGIASLRRRNRSRVA
jgi:hypothetical protein